MHLKIKTEVQGVANSDILASLDKLRLKLPRAIENASSPNSSDAKVYCCIVKNSFNKGECKVKIEELNLNNNARAVVNFNQFLCLAATKILPTYEEFVIRVDLPEKNIEEALQCFGGEFQKNCIHYTGVFDDGDTRYLTARIDYRLLHYANFTSSNDVEWSLSELTAQRVLEFLHLFTYANNHLLETIKKHNAFATVASEHHHNLLQPCLKAGGIQSNAGVWEVARFRYQLSQIGKLDANEVIFLHAAQSAFSTMGHGQVSLSESVQSVNLDTVARLTEKEREEAKHNVNSSLINWQRQILESRRIEIVNIKALQLSASSLAESQWACYHAEAEKYNASHHLPKVFLSEKSNSSSSYTVLSSINEIYQKELASAKSEAKPPSEFVSTSHLYQAASFLHRAVPLQYVSRLNESLERLTSSFVWPESDWEGMFNSLEQCLDQLLLFGDDVPVNANNCIICMRDYTDEHSVQMLQIWLTEASKSSRVNIVDLSSKDEASLKADANGEVAAPRKTKKASLSHLVSEGKKIVGLGQSTVVGNPVLIAGSLADNAKMQPIQVSSTTKVRAEVSSFVRGGIRRSIKNVKYLRDQISKSSQSQGEASSRAVQVDNSATPKPTPTSTPAELATTQEQSSSDVSARLDRNSGWRKSFKSFKKQAARVKDGFMKQTVIAVSPVDSKSVKVEPSTEKAAINASRRSSVSVEAAGSIESLSLQQSSDDELNSVQDNASFTVDGQSIEEYESYFMRGVVQYLKKHQAELPEQPTQEQWSTLVALYKEIVTLFPSEGHVLFALLHDIANTLNLAKESVLRERELQLKDGEKSVFRDLLRLLKAERPYRVFLLGKNIADASKLFIEVLNYSLMPNEASVSEETQKLLKDLKVLDEGKTNAMLQLSLTKVRVLTHLVNRLNAYN